MFCVGEDPQTVKLMTNKFTGDPGNIFFIIIFFGEFSRKCVAMGKFGASDTFYFLLKIGKNKFDFFRVQSGQKILFN